LEILQILGYVGFAVLIFLAVTWTIQIRIELGAGVPVMAGTLFFLVAALVLIYSGANKLHSLWIIPAGFALTRFTAYSTIPMRPIFNVIRFFASCFAMIVRIGIPSQRIDAALNADDLAAVKRMQRKP
jgi:hypothetical protein